MLTYYRITHAHAVCEYSYPVLRFIFSLLPSSYVHHSSTFQRSYSVDRPCVVRRCCNRAAHHSTSTLCIWCNVLQSHRWFSFTSCHKTLTFLQLCNMYSVDNCISLIVTYPPIARLVQSMLVVNENMRITNQSIYSPNEIFRIVKRV